MKLKSVNPITNGSRHQLNLMKFLLSKSNTFFKKALTPNKILSGRSTLTGRITVRHQGAGCKRLFRTIEETNLNSYSLVVSTFYDPKRSAFISLNFNITTKMFFLKLLTESIFPGAIISCDKNNTDLRLGYRTVLKNIPTGSILHSIALKNNKKAQYIKAAGTAGQLIQKDFKMCKIKLPSSVILTIPIDSYATLGIVSNKLHNLVVIGKAGRNRLKGIRPSVRGIAMNPVDHPHGGRTNGGMPSVTPWGKPTRGKPTVCKKKI